MSHYKVPWASDEINAVIRLIDIAVIEAELRNDHEREIYWRQIREKVNDAEYFDPIVENDN